VLRTVRLIEAAPREPRSRNPEGLQAQYQFRKTKGAWLQEGTCPACNKREAFCAAKDPKIVRCGRQDRCGWEITVRDALPDLFEDWSKRFPETEENPTATADAYLQHERCLDLRSCAAAIPRNSTAITRRATPRPPSASPWAIPIGNG
jgi:hypothetical protein